MPTFSVVVIVTAPADPAAMAWASTSGATGPTPAGPLAADTVVDHARAPCSPPDPTAIDRAALDPRGPCPDRCAGAAVDGHRADHPRSARRSGRARLRSPVQPGPRAPSAGHHRDDAGVTGPAHLRVIVTITAIRPGRAHPGHRQRVDQTGLLWDLSGLDALRADPMERACSLSGGALDAGEWGRSVPGLAYVDSCSQ